MINKTKKEWIVEKSDELKEHSMNKRTKIEQMKRGGDGGVWISTVGSLPSGIGEEPLFALAHSFNESEGHRSRSQTWATNRAPRVTLTHVILQWNISENS